MMYYVTPAEKSTMKGIKSYAAESLEKKVERIVTQREPIKDGAPRIYTDRKDGVRPELNPRTDKWDIAADTLGTMAKTHIAKRAGAAKVVDMNEKKPDGGAESTQGTKD